MDTIEALRIARIALAQHYDIEPDVVDGRYVGAYVANGARKCDVDAAEAYNKLAEMQKQDQDTKEYIASPDAYDARPVVGLDMAELEHRVASQQSSSDLCNMRYGSPNWSHGTFTERTTADADALAEIASAQGSVEEYDERANRYE